MKQRDGTGAFGLVFLAIAAFLFTKRFASAEPGTGDGGDAGGGTGGVQVETAGQLGTITVRDHHVLKFPGEPIIVSFNWTAATKNFLNIGVPWDYRARVLFGHSTVFGWRKSGRLGFAEDGDRIIEFPNRSNGTYTLELGPGGGPDRFDVPFIAPDDDGQSWDIHVHLEALKSDSLGNPIPNDWVQIDQSDHNGAVTTIAGSGSATVGGTLTTIAVARKHRLGRVRR